MRVCIIPPIPHLDEASGRHYHLVLAHLCDDPRYVEFYRKEADQGSFVIADNGAHEHGSGESVEFLLKLAKRLHAQEIVLPDFLEGADETISLTSAALTYLMRHPEQVEASGILSIMVVPQGDSIWSWRRCLYHLMELLHRSDLDLGFTLGLSKDYDVFDGGLYGLLEKDLLPVAETLDIEIHLLGWEKDLFNLERVGRHFGNRIRSIDSARPFVYATQGIDINMYEDSPIYPHRPESYFNLTMSEDQIAIARRNVKLFELLSTGAKRSVTSRWIRGE